MLRNGKYLTKYEQNKLRTSRAAINFKTEFLSVAEENKCTTQ